MERKRTVQGPNGPVEGTELGFRSSGEYWNEYLLDDGTVVRLKVVVMEAYRLDGEYDPDGNPQYVVKSSNLMVVSAPDELRRGVGGS